MSLKNCRICKPKPVSQVVDMEVYHGMDLDNNNVSDMDWEHTPSLISNQLARLDRMREVVRIKKARQMGCLVYLFWKYEKLN